MLIARCQWWLETAPKSSRRCPKFFLPNNEAILFAVKRLVFADIELQRYCEAMEFIEIQILWSVSFSITDSHKILHIENPRQARELYVPFSSSSTTVTARIRGREVADIFCSLWAVLSVDWFLGTRVDHSGDDSRPSPLASPPSLPSLSARCPFASLRVARARAYKTWARPGFTSVLSYSFAIVEVWWSLFV